MDPTLAAKNALKYVLEATSGESIVVICDDVFKDIGRAFAHGAIELGLWSRLELLEPKKERTSVPKHLVEIVSNQKADIYINLLRGNSGETPFRIQLIKMETRNKARLGHCPGIALDMLTKGALARNEKDYTEMQKFAKKLSQKCEDARAIRIKTPTGTDLFMGVEGRSFFTDTKIDWKTLKWMNLPVGEVIVGPQETSLEGILVCDNAVGGIGITKNPLTITAKNGRAVSVKTQEKTVLKAVKRSLKTDEWSEFIGEFAFGINPKARLTKEFLETEKIKGTCHIAFGNNSDFPGGKNTSANHMDFLMKKPTVDIIGKDGNKLRVLENGTFKVK
jgi:leucyl aminopeptidase (aminopeptidase T)